jgi:hypothetical protein
MKIIIDEFIESLKARQASQNTIASYERDIMQFSNYFESQNKKIFDLTKEDSVEVLIDENNPVEVTMELTPETVDVKPGSTQEFKATVTAPEGTDTAVVWTVEGNLSENTKVSENGVLTVAADETAEALTVKATSKVDDRVYDSASVTVEKVVTTVDKVTVAPSADVKV